MKEDGKQIERMEAYLAGELSLEERVTFEQELAQDPVLQQRFRLFQEVETTFSDAEDVAFFQSLQAVREERKPKTLSRDLRPLYFSLAIAAGVAVLLWIFWPQTQPERGSPNELIASVMEPYPMLLAARSGAGQDSLLNLAIQAYQANEFAAAAAGFANLQELGAADPQIALYAGLSFLFSGQSVSAQNVLSSLLPHAPPELKGVVQWHLSLAYLQNGEYESGREVLNSISEEPYRSRAGELLESLENISDF